MANNSRKAVEYNRDFHHDLAEIRTKHKLSDEIYDLFEQGKLSDEDILVLEKFRYTKAKEELKEKVATVKNSDEYLEAKEARKEAKELVKRLMELTGKTKKEAEIDVYGAELETITSPEKELPFEDMEKIVLAKLPESEVKRMTAMRKYLGEKAEFSYQQAIKALHQRPITIDNKNRVVKFGDVGVALCRDELQLPITQNETIREVEYTDFEGNKVKRIEVEQGVFDNNHTNPLDKKKYKEGYTIVEDVLKKEEEKGKKLANDNDAFNPILDSFEGSKVEKFLAMEFIRGFLGWGIMGKEKNENDARSVFKCSKNNVGIWDGSNSYNEGSLILSMDC